MHVQSTFAPAMMFSSYRWDVEPCANATFGRAEFQLLTSSIWLLTLDNRAFMAESQTFYLSYAPAMEILQHRGITF